MSVALAPSPVFQGLGFGGLPLPGGKLFTYIAGTSTPQATYVDSTQTTPNANPVILNANGQANIWLVTGQVYKLILQDFLGNQIWSVDQIQGGLSAAAIGAILYPQTPQELAAGVTPANFVIASHASTNGIFYPERYGANTNPGTTPMSTTIQTAITVATQAGGGVIQLSDTSYQLGVIAVTVPSNIRITMSNGGQILVNSSSPAAMPQAYFSITGSNVEIDHIKGFIAANPFTTYLPQGALIGFAANNISNIKIHDNDGTWFMHGIFGSWQTTITANTVSNVIIERNRFTSFATDIFHTGLSPTNWTIRNNTNESISHIASNNAGAIQIMPGVSLSNVDLFTESAYDTGYGLKIVVTDNSANNSLDRPYRFINCQQLEVADNNLTLKVGSFFSDPTQFSGDALTFDLCRKLSCHDNTIFGGGENGIDLLSCQDYQCHDNIVKQANTGSLFVFLSDLWTASSTSPKLSSITTRSNLQNLNGDIHDNDVEAFDCLHVGAGQNIKVHDNNVKLFKTSTNWITGNTPDMISLDNSSGAAFFTESTANWMHDIEFKNNKPVLIGPVSVTCNSGTGIFTTVGAVPHGFVTGDRVETVAAGTSTTVDFPGNLVFTSDYWVIFVSSTTFKIASSLVNAFAGTAFTLSSNGLTTSGSALLFREQTAPAVININSLYYTPAQNMTLDENIGLVSTNLFSTLSTINPGVSFLFKYFKHQYIYDPAVNYGNTRNIIDKYFNIVPIAASNGTTVFGISAFNMASSGYQFAPGAKPANIAGAPADGQIKTSFW